MRPFSKFSMGVALLVCAASQAVAQDLDRRIAVQVERLERLLPPEAVQANRVVAERLRPRLVALLRGADWQLRFEREIDRELAMHGAPVIEPPGTSRFLIGALLLAPVVGTAVGAAIGDAANEDEAAGGEPDRRLAAMVRELLPVMERSGDPAFRARKRP